MSKRLIFNSSEIRFPPACLVCQLPAEKQYEISRSFSYGNRSLSISIPVPLCLNHFVIASSKSRGERLVGQIGLGLGTLLGIGVALALLSYWISSEQGNLVPNLFLAAFIGLGAFLITWALLAFFIAPLFASPETKAVRGAMKILHYWPANQNIQLEFANEALAELIARDNADRLVHKE